MSGLQSQCHSSSRSMSSKIEEVGARVVAHVTITMTNALCHSRSTVFLLCLSCRIQLTSLHIRCHEQLRMMLGATKIQQQELHVCRL